MQSPLYRDILTGEPMVRSPTIHTSLKNLFLIGGPEIVVVQNRVKK